MISGWKTSDRGIGARAKAMTNVISVATLKPFEGKQEETLQLLREFYTFMAKKGYSHDVLYRDIKEANKFLHLRIWRSADARQEAQEDPDVHHFWMRLPEVCEITIASQNLELLFSSFDGSMLKE